MATDPVVEAARRTAAKLPPMPDELKRRVAELLAPEPKRRAS